MLSIRAILSVGWTLLMASVALGQSTGPCEPSVTSNEPLGGTDGPVYAAAAWDPDGAGPLGEVAVIGGAFSIAGNQLASNVATWDPVTGTCGALGAGFNGTVRALLVTTTGELYAAGEFTLSGTTAIARVARWSSTTMTWEALGAGTDGTVFTLAQMPTGAIAAGGRFTTAGGVTANNVAQWNPATGNWSAWGGGVSYFNSVTSATVYSIIARASGEMVLGGQFREVSGSPALYVASWNPSTSTWAAIGPTTGVSGVITSTVYSVCENTQGVLYAGGAFSSTLTGLQYLAYFNGTQWSPARSAISGDLDGPVRAMSQRGTVVNAVGDFQNFKLGTVNTFCGNVVALSGNGSLSLWSTIFGGPQGNNTAGGGIYCASDRVGTVGYTVFGGLGSHGSTKDRNLMKAEPVNSPYSAAVTGLDAPVHALAFSASSGRTIAAGEFARIGIAGTLAQGIAFNDGAGWSFTGLVPGLISSVSIPSGIGTLASGDLVLAGRPIGVGTTATIFSHWATPSGPWTAMNTTSTGGATPAGLPRSKTLIALPNGRVVAGGFFTTIDGVAGTDSIAQWDPATRTWSPMGAGLSGGVVALCPVGSSGDLIAGGLFTTIGGTPFNRVARWSASSGAWQTLGTGVGGNVYAVTVLPSGEVIAAGAFTSAGGGPANRIARWDGSAWHAMGSSVPGGGFDGEVNALAVTANGEVIAGGLFSSADGTVVNNLARWDGTRWNPIGSGTNGRVRAIQVRSSDVMIAGDFTTINGTVSAYLGTVLVGTSAVEIVTQPTIARCMGSQFGFALEATGSGPLTYQWQAEVPFNSGTYINLNDATALGVATSGTRTDTVTFSLAGAQSFPAIFVTRYRCRVSNSCSLSTSAIVGAIPGPCACSVADVAGLGGSLGPDGRLTPDDVIVFLDGFFSLRPVSDVASLGGGLGADGLWTADDVIAFLSAFFAGCP